MNVRACVSDVYNRPDMIAYYEHLAQHSGLWKAEHDLIKQYCNPFGTLLAIGCGTGREVFPLQEEGEYIVGMDLAMQPLLIADKKRHTLQVAHIKFLQADAVSLPYRNECFDNVLMLAQIIQHIPQRRNRRQVLCEARRVLKPGGYCLLSAFNKSISLVYLLLIGKQYQQIIRNDMQSDAVTWQTRQGCSRIFNRIARKMHPVVRRYSDPLPPGVKMMFSLYCYLLNTQRTLRARVSRHPERIPEPNDFMIDHVAFRFRIIPQQGDLFAHFPDIEEVIEDIRAAGFTLVDYKSLEELQQGQVVSDKDRRSKRLIFYVMQKRTA